MLIAASGGGMRNGTAALVTAGRLTSVCSQERVTRVRGAGLNRSGLPDEALDLLLGRLGRTRAEVTRYVAAVGDGPSPPNGTETVDHHLAHAATAHLTSPFSDSTVVVCDHEAPDVSVWRAEGGRLTPLAWPWEGPGFSNVFSRCSAALGFGFAADQRTEALGRLRPDSRDVSVEALIHLTGDRLAVDPALERMIAERVVGDAPGGPKHAAVAAGLQARLGDLFIEFLQLVRQATNDKHLCLGGSFFYHSSINSRVRQSRVFTDVFVPVDPGDSGLAVGAALLANGYAPSPASPFLGPTYSSEETKLVVDNCKLQYAWESEEDAAMIAVRALREGRLVGWFEGGMEWGPRALGARCILANPTAPYVLDNLNRFLKRRDPWRGYALSGLAEAVPEHFDGPGTAPFMECDFRPRDPGRFREALPSPGAAARVQTVAAEGGQPRFRRLLEAFGEETGLPFLINTSFNGFHEPIVCNPRDAVRVFYGTGLDVLVLNQFVLRK